MVLKLIENNDISNKEMAKMFLFSRWLNINYSSDVLNKKNGEWLLHTIKFFEEYVFKEYLVNTVYNDTLIFIENFMNKENGNKSGEIDFTTFFDRCDTCGNGLNNCTCDYPF